MSDDALRHVLLVEDDSVDAFLVGELLAEVDPDLKLTVAPSLDAAMEWVRSADCVLLDLNLPGTTGLDAVHALLRDDATTAVCVLTGLDDEDLGRAAVAAGAQDYLVKGKADAQVLIRSLRYAVERRRAETGLVRLREEQMAAAESTRLERGLLPRPLLDGSTVRARSLYRSGRTRSGRARAVLGGDFFDAVRGPTGTVHAIVGDVCGHGPDEAALGALLRVSFRALVLAGVEEARLLPELQALLVSERHEKRLFTTAVTVAIDEPVFDGSGIHGPATAMTIRLAGHPPPLALGPSPRSLAPPVGLPLGIVAHTEWTPLRVTLEQGWALLLYTDGLVEGRGAVPGELLWPEGLVTLLEEEHATPLDGLPARLLERAERYHGGPLVDDVAILLLTGGEV